MLVCEGQSTVSVSGQMIRLKLNEDTFHIKIYLLSYKDISSVWTIMILNQNGTCHRCKVLKELLYSNDHELDWVCDVIQLTPITEVGLIYMKLKIPKALRWIQLLLMPDTTIESRAAQPLPT